MSFLLIEFAEQAFKYYIYAVHIHLYYQTGWSWSGLYGSWIYNYLYNQWL